LTAAEDVLHEAHLDVSQAVPRPDIIGFHGQTVAHDSSVGRTHQVGDGARLATNTGVPVVYDFRSLDMKHGGQGAPLAPIFHHAAARAVGLTAPVVFLNIGGVSNVTWLDPQLPPEAMVAFDTGPGNALIDDFVSNRTGAVQDTDGVLAMSGATHHGLIAGIGREFLEREPPKSLDRHDFHAALRCVEALSDADGAATLAALTVETISAAQVFFPRPPVRWLVCGGGRHNPALMSGLRERVTGLVDPVEAVGLNGDLLEAQAFGYLAVRAMRALPTSFPGTTGCAKPVSGGVIVYPQR
jgi:anhydro-N-acetylmuramic acid kinase